MHHFSVRSLGDQIAKLNRYSDQQADDLEARIFALTFDPELVAIAGFYAVRENLGEVPKGRAVQVRLDGEQMRFEALG